MKKLSKKMLSFLLASVLIIQSIGLIPAYAEEGDPSGTPPGVENFVDPEGSPPPEAGEEIETPPLEGDDETPISPEEGDEGTILPKDGEEGTLPEEEDKGSIFGNFAAAFSGRTLFAVESLTEAHMNITNVVFYQGSETIEDTAGEYLLDLGVDELDKTFYLAFNFSLDENHNFKEGDYYTFTIPTAFDLKSTTGQIVDNGVTIANWTVAGEEVKITFTDAINDGAPVYNGEFKISWALGSSIISGSLEKEIEFDIGGQKTLKIKVANPETNHTISKSNGTHVRNGATVQWSVDVNKSTQDIGNKTLTDSMVADVVPSSIEVYELTPTLSNGKITFVESDNPATDGFTLATGNTFPITFADGNTKAYRIKYQTTVAEDQREDAFNANGSTEITNTVTLTLCDRIVVVGYK